MSIFNNHAYFSQFCCVQTFNSTFIDKSNICFLLETNVNATESKEVCRQNNMTRFEFLSYLPEYFTLSGHSYLKVLKENIKLSLSYKNNLDFVKTARYFWIGFNPIINDDRTIWGLDMYSWTNFVNIEFKDEQFNANKCLVMDIQNRTLKNYNCNETLNVLCYRPQFGFWSNWETSNLCKEEGYRQN